MEPLVRIWAMVFCDVLSRQPTSSVWEDMHVSVTVFSIRHRERLVLRTFATFTTFATPDRRLGDHDLHLYGPAEVVARLHVLTGRGAVSATAVRMRPELTTLQIYGEHAVGGAAGKPQMLVSRCASAAERWWTRGKSGDAGTSLLRVSALPP